MNSIMFLGIPRCTEPTRSGRMKWKFRSQLAALMVAHGFSRHGGEVLHVYACPRCLGWHTTRQPQRSPPAYWLCGCGHASHAYDDKVQHLREAHGRLLVEVRPSGRIKLVPITSHPEVQRWYRPQTPATGTT